MRQRFAAASSSLRVRSAAEVIRSSVNHARAYNVGRIDCVPTLQGLRSDVSTD